MTRWAIGAAEIEALISAGALQTITGNAANGEPWLTKAATTLASARSLVAQDSSSAYVLGYDAARQACVGLLAQQGVRPTTSGGHYAVEQAVRAQFRDAFAVFGTLRRSRNRIEYPVHPTDQITADQAREALDAVATVLEQAAQLLPSLGLF
jgi:hypothetical protein